MKIMRVSLQSKLDELMSLSTRIPRVNVCSNDISSSRFDCSESRVIFIAEYVWNNKRSSSSFDCGETRVIFFEEYVSTLKSVHPPSIAVKHALFLSRNTCG